ncbi:MAG: biotin synthase BioB [Leptospiraceae bacterium]|nr:biotin synthase BioB [Leptospiraceae bacterium]MCP5498159.1 biotin synthase BioB [Leptospiraceae bacterium]
MIALAEQNTSKTESKITKDRALKILGDEIPLTQILHESYLIRQEFFSNKVRIHVLDNIQNGYCPEDCGYCAQRKGGNSGIQEYPMKSEGEIFSDAKMAKEKGAYRFCMVSAGTGPNDKNIDRLSGLVRKITNELGLKVCVSAGILDENKAEKLKEAGLDRYNHNINTAENHYGEICSTHTYQNRLQTLEIVKKYKIGICSGLIVGLGESKKDIVEVAFELKRLGVLSIPVNFFIPIAGHAIKNPTNLSPELCIRILAMFRLVNPDSEIRMAAGREGHLRSMQAMGLYPANSLFVSGYLNVKGSNASETLKMIQDAGFVPEFEEGGFDFATEEEHLYSQDNIQNLYKYKRNNVSA